MSIIKDIFMIIKNRKLQTDNSYTEDVSFSKIPVHIGIIMDGNGRWAKKRGLIRSAGHLEGIAALKRTVRNCSDFGIRYLTVYAFSTENWIRPKSEVDSIMNLLLKFLKRSEQELEGEKVRVRVIGDIEPLSDEIKAEIKRVEKETMLNDKIDLIFALNYGGRHEIVDAVKKIGFSIAKGEIDPDEVSEELISANMYMPEIPYPDMIIRPSGEMRFSNFLLWQSAYSEFWFSSVLWPDFNKQNLVESLIAYNNRDRRFGGIKEESENK